MVFTDPARNRSRHRPPRGSYGHRGFKQRPGPPETHHTASQTDLAPGKWTSGGVWRIVLGSRQLMGASVAEASQDWRTDRPSTPGRGRCMRGFACSLSRGAAHERAKGCARRSQRRRAYHRELSDPRVIIAHARSTPPRVCRRPSRTADSARPGAGLDRSARSRSRLIRSAVSATPGAEVHRRRPSGS